MVRKMTEMYCELKITSRLTEQQKKSDWSRNDENKN